MHRSAIRPEAGWSEGAGLWSWRVLGQIPGLLLTSRVAADEALNSPQPLLSHL